METTLESILVVRKENKVVAFGHNDIEKRATVFYKTTNQDMSLEDYKELLENK